MCFYKDTQNALTKNSLSKLFLSKVAHSHQTQKANVSQRVTFPVKTEEEIEDLPHKKLHISNDLFSDLLKLSAGDPICNNMTETSTSEGTQSPSYNAASETNLVSQNMGLKYEHTPEESSMGNFDELLQMIERTNRTLQEYKKTQSLLEKQIETMSRQTRNDDFEECPFERLNKVSLREKQAVRATTCPTADELLSHFTKGRTNFPYAIRLSVKLPSPILRERNIKIGVELIKTSDGSLVENHGSMILQMSLHTWELPSNPILRNKSGNKVLQGEDECELKNGKASFDKLQINEVTSKFINGYIGVLVVAKRPINFGTSLDSIHQKRLIKIQDIQPLLVEKVIVKSKKKNTTAKPQTQ